MHDNSLIYTSDVTDTDLYMNETAPEPSATGESGPVTQKSLYTGLFVIGIPLLWLAAPLSTIFWIVGASSVLILGHASMLEPGVVSRSFLAARETVTLSGRMLIYSAAVPL